MCLGFVPAMLWGLVRGGYGDGTGNETGIIGAFGAALRFGRFALYGGLGYVLLRHFR
jgi:hypothetical protein